MNEKQLPQHSFGETISYHLLPGVAILAGYVLITPFVRSAGFPSAVGISLVVLFVLVPLELGILFWQGKKRNSRYSLDGIVLNREKTPRRAFILWMLAALFGAVLSFALFSALDKALLPLFGWLPDWFFVNEDLSFYSALGWALFVLTSHSMTIFAQKTDRGLGGEPFTGSSRSYGGQRRLV